MGAAVTEDALETALDDLWNAIEHWPVDGYVLSDAQLPLGSWTEVILGIPHRFTLLASHWNPALTRWVSPYRKGWVETHQDTPRPDCDHAS